MTEYLSRQPNQSYNKGANLAADQWYVLGIKPKRDNAVIELLIARGVDYYYPYVWVQRYQERKPKQNPYFPGYVFVHIDPAGQQAADLRWLPGVKTFVTYGNEMVDVPENVMRSIRQQVGEINANGGIKPLHFQPGEQLVITSGPFKGYSGIFSARLTGGQRIRVLLQMLLNRKVAVEINETDAKRK